jgi:hypothetical protein
MFDVFVAHGATDAWFDAGRGLAPRPAAVRRSEARKAPTKRVIHRTHSRTHVMNPRTGSLDFGEHPRDRSTFIGLASTPLDTSGRADPIKALASSAATAKSCVWRSLD